MNLIYTKKLDFCNGQTDVGAQKLYKSYLKFFKIVIP